MTPAANAAIENCDECGFGWDRYRDEQAVGVFLATGALYRQSLADLDLELANTRPAADSWSILEYVDHVRNALWIWRFAVEAAVGEPGIDLRTDGERELSPEVTRFEGVESTVGALEAESAELFTVLLGLTPEQWACTALVTAGVVDQRWIVRHALHEVVHHLHDVGRVRARLGDAVASQTGSVVQLNLGGGGVPKLPVDEVEITAGGLVGDHQNDRVHHGRPFQAVCLYSKEVIEALNDEGHPIYPGAAGENVTVEGIDWAALRPGALVSIGDEVELELSSYAIPCVKNAQWFVDGKFRRMLHDRHPGWSRMYAAVLRPGRVRPGDIVRIEP